MMIDVRKLIVGGLFLVAAVLLLLGIVNAPAMAIANPSAVYCEALGYKYVVESTPEGARGLCQMPNGETVSAWQFLKGKVAQEYSYCQQKGYQIKTVKDRKTCSRFGLEECAVCVLEDGTEVEVTELMGLDFAGPGYYRIPNSTIIIVALTVATVAVVLAVVLFVKRRARPTAKGKRKKPTKKGNSTAI
jgi:putative hemolysin